MGFWSDIGDALTGTVSQGTYNNLPQYQGPQASNYQIPGLQGYQSGISSLLGQGSPQLDTTNVDADRGMQQQSLQQLQAQANGTGPSPAQVFNDQNQQQNLRNIQAQALTQQAGVNPGLAFRGLLNAQGALTAQTAGQSALMQQQNQQQAQQQYAQQLASFRGQDFGQAQQQVQNQFQGTQQQAGLIGQQYGMAQGQTQNNIAYGNAVSGLAAQQRQDAMARAQAQATGTQSIFKGLLSAGGAVAGGIAAGGAGSAAGGQAGNALLPTSTGSSGGSLGQLYPGTYGGPAAAGYNYGA